MTGAPCAIISPTNLEKPLDWRAVNNFSWVIEGEIAGMAQPPASGEALWQWLHERGIKLVVSLTPRSPDRELLARYSMEVLHLPVPDFTPPAPEIIRKFLEHARFYRRQKQALVVHCAAGIGRTGTLIACYLVDRGMDADAAIAAVRKARPGSIETGEQEEAVRRLERELRAGQARPKA